VGHTLSSTAVDVTSRIKGGEMRVTAGRVCSISNLSKETEAQGGKGAA